MLCCISLSISREVHLLVNLSSFVQGDEELVVWTAGYVNHEFHNRMCMSIRVFVRHLHIYNFVKLILCANFPIAAHEVARAL